MMMPMAPVRPVTMVSQVWKGASKLISIVTTLLRIAWKG